MSNDSDVKDIVEAAQTFKARFILCFVNEEPTLNYAKDLLHSLQKLPKILHLCSLVFLRLKLADVMHK